MSKFNVYTCDIVFGIVTGIISSFWGEYLPPVAPVTASAYVLFSLLLHVVSFLDIFQLLQLNLKALFHDIYHH